VLTPLWAPGSQLCLDLPQGRMLVDQPLGPLVINLPCLLLAHHRGEFALVQVRGPGLSCFRPRRFKFKLPPAPV
jgi:hypothetical protein